MNVHVQGDDVVCKPVLLDVVHVFEMTEARILLAGLEACQLPQPSLEAACFRSLCPSQGCSYPLWPGRGDATNVVALGEGSRRCRIHVSLFSLSVVHA